MNRKFLTPPLPLLRGESKNFTNHLRSLYHNIHQAIDFAFRDFIHRNFDRAFHHLPPLRFADFFGSGC